MTSIFSFFKKEYDRVAGLSPHIKRLLVLAFIFTLIFELIKLVPPFIFKNIIDSLVKFDPANPISFKMVAIIVLGYFGAMLCMNFIEWFGKKMIIYRIIEAEIDVITSTLRKFLKLDVAYHENHNTGKSINTLIKGSRHIVDVLFSIIDQMLPIGLQMIITLVTLLFLSWEVAVVYFVFMIIFLNVLLNDAAQTQKLRKRVHDEFDEIAGTAAQSIANVRTVKDFGNEEKEMSKTNSILKEYREDGRKRTTMGMRNFLTNSVLLTIARGVTLLLCTWLLFKMKLTVGAVVLVVTLTEKAYINMGSVSRVYYRMQDTEPSIERLNHVMQEKINLTDKPDSRYRITKGKIEFKKVTFAYGNDSRHALKNVSFEVPPKKIIALVGRSGSGKSTAMKLLLRKFDPTKGEIIVDNIPLQDFSFKNLKKEISIVSQDVELFDESLAENIAYGVNNATKQDIIKTAKMAHAHDFIMQFDHGYDTIVGERGVKLSGGQKQRIAIARALIRNPKIMVFDEATCSLDSESERFIQDAIFKLKGKLTLIIIAHRFSTIEKADKIILLENGEVKEVGTSSELMHKKGIFAKLRKLQKLGEVE